MISFPTADTVPLSEQAAVCLSGVTRTFRARGKNVVAVRDVFLSVPHGTFLVITGRSGSGKTTLMNLMGGLDRPDSGTVSVLGHSLGRMREGALTAFRRRCVGYVFQDSLLLPGLTALENVVAGGLPGHSWRSLVGPARELLGAIGLSERVDFAPENLSGGERQRVSIARALLTQPALLLADEPTGNLDATSTGELLTLFGRLQRELDLTVVVASHDPDVASFAPTTLTLSEGHLSERSSVS